MVQLAAELDDGVVGSICYSSYDAFMAQVVELALARVASGCEREAQGSTAEETL